MLTSIAYCLKKISNHRRPVNTKTPVRSIYFNVNCNKISLSTFSKSQPENSGELNFLFFIFFCFFVQKTYFRNYWVYLNSLNGPSKNRKKLKNAGFWFNFNTTLKLRIKLIEHKYCPLYNHHGTNQSTATFNGSCSNQSSAFLLPPASERAENAKIYY